MRVVLDSNIYIFALGAPRRVSCEALVDHLVARSSAFTLKIARPILEEVQRNVAPQQFKLLWELVNALGGVVDEEWEVPFAIGTKFAGLGLKPGDAFIAAYTEWTGAEYLITENRHFLRRAHLPFQIVRAEEFLKGH